MSQRAHSSSPELILHSYRRCPFAIRVRMVLEEKELHYVVIEENLSTPSAELLRLHPEGQVPLLKHGEMIIHESSIITEYLEEVFPAPKLNPHSPQGRAQMRLWTYWCNFIFKPDLDIFKYRLNELPETEITELENRMRAHLDKLGSSLSSQQFLLGHELTLADIHVFPFYRQLQKIPSERLKALLPPKANEWLDRITLRPSFKRVMAKQATTYGVSHD